MTAQPSTHRTPEQVRAEGIQALATALGPDDLVRFLLQFDRGSGDYTAARQEWVDQLDLDTVLRRLEQQHLATDAVDDHAPGRPGRPAH
jgi:uncharacterized protein YciU (UPF0263 family)